MPEWFHPKPLNPKTQNSYILNPIDPFKGTLIDPFKGTLIDPFTGTQIPYSRALPRLRLLPEGSSLADFGALDGQYSRCLV